MVRRVWGKTDFSHELDFLCNPQWIAFSYNVSELTKDKNNNIIFSSFLFEDEGSKAELTMPQEKFIDLIEVLKKNAYLQQPGYRPTEVIFTFDDELNCTVESRYENEAKHDNFNIQKI